jgi:molybdopterin converting factor small subunit
MTVKVMIPTPLRAYAGGSRQVEVSGPTVGDALTDLAGRHPQLRRHLYAETGDLRGFVNVYLNQENVKDLEGTRTSVADGDLLTIVPSIAGG